MTKATYRIVDANDNIFDGQTGLTLVEAESALCRFIGFGEDAYIQDEA